MPILATILNVAARRLETVTETPRLDAELLLAHALECSRSRLLAHMRETIDIPETYENLLQRRLNFEPIGYITGTWEFFSLEFICRPPILVPRPETEHLVEKALDVLENKPLRVLDCCTGTGCIAIAIAKNAPNAEVTATDLNPGALKLAQENATRHDVAIDFYQGDLFTALPEDAPLFDLILSNPPYVEAGSWANLSPVITRHEDPGALLSGGDGLDCIRRIIREAPQYLKSGGILALEMGEGQWLKVKELFQDAGYGDAGIIKDLAGIERIAYSLVPE